ncbi:MAG: hypothetical protein HYY30_10970 [Chloroflexi bacterium]|nr:hypothetical protein [Chloroflexota bacterium]
MQGRGRPSPYVVDAGVFSGYLEVARAYLDEASFDRAWAEGQTMSLEEAIDCALASDGEN